MFSWLWWQTCFWRHGSHVWTTDIKRTGSSFCCFSHFWSQKIYDGHLGETTLLWDLSLHKCREKIDGSDSSKDFLRTVCVFQIHNLQTADQKVWRVRWSHQDSGNQNKLASNFGAFKQQVARSSLFFFLDRWANHTYKNYWAIPNPRACSKLKISSCVNSLLRSNNEKVNRNVTPITTFRYRKPLERHCTFSDIIWGYHQRTKTVDDTIHTISLTLIIIETKGSRGSVKIPSERTTGILSNSP